MNTAQENYLKTILSYELDGQQATISALADSLSLKPGSVTEMIKKLSAMGYVEHQNYKGFKLSAKGRLLATRVLRRHRLWETFLFKVLHYPWSEVHEEAEKFEHLTSEKMEARMDTLLGHPQFDPHGHPIPAADGTIYTNVDEGEWLPLSCLSPGQQGRIVQVKNESDAFLSLLDSIDLKLGTLIKVENILEFDRSMKIKTNQQTIFLSHKVAKEIVTSRSLPKHGRKER